MDNGHDSRIVKLSGRLSLASRAAYHGMIILVYQKRSACVGMSSTAQVFPSVPGAMEMKENDHEVWVRASLCCSF